MTHSVVTCPDRAYEYVVVTAAKDGALRNVTCNGVGTWDTREDAEKVATGAVAAGVVSFADVLQLI